MPLRSQNDRSTPAQVLAALAQIAPVNTRVGTLGGSALVNTGAPFTGLTVTFPSVLVTEGPQSAAKVAYALWQTKLIAYVDYYDRWDTQTVSLDTLWAQVDADLRRMKANLEDNPTLTIAGSRGCDGIVKVELSDYIGRALTKTDSPLQIPVVTRRLTAYINLLAYTSAR